MGNTAISIIVPCYNGERNLPAFISSVQNQNFGLPFEVIFALDPSQDGTLGILTKICQADPRFRFLAFKERLGSSVSRHAGIKASVGDYIYFADADDMLAPNCLSTLYSTIVEKKADAVDCGFFCLGQGGRLGHGSFKPYKMKTLGSMEAERALLFDDSIRGFLWTKMYRRAVVTDGLTLACPPPCIIGEDMSDNFAYFSRCRTIVSISDRLYYYRKDGSGTTAAKNPLRANQHLITYSLMRLYCEKTSNAALLKVYRDKLWRGRLSLAYDLYLSKRAGLSRAGARSIKADFRLLGKEGRLPVAGKPWEEAFANATK